jgi:hypothetical protein
MDVKCAFLNMDLDENIYMKQLDGHKVLRCKDLVYKLKKTIYGFKQVHRVSLMDFLKDLNSTCVK